MIETFVCVAPGPKLTLTRAACARRYRVVRKGAEGLINALPMPCKRCTIGAAHARKETPDVVLVQLTVAPSTKAHKPLLCEVCGKPLPGRRTRVCSIGCASSAVATSPISGLDW